MIQLSHGSIFDKKCDLLIIPCNDTGGVTKWVFSSLKDNGLPIPQFDVPFGNVTFVETKHSLENAGVVGFAASVQSHPTGSSKSAIRRIGEQIYSYCKENKLRQVNIPLLGTGAGQLSPVDSFESLYKPLEKEKLNDTIFEIFVPSLDNFKSLRASFSEILDKSREENPTNPRVFLSYAGDDEINRKWVKDLATKLRQNGVDARIDTFNLKPGIDLPQWMTDEVIMAEKVILVCDSNYVKKADIRSGGVGWETMIIQGDMLTQGENKTKYLAIVREEKIDKGLPIYIKSKKALHWKKTEEITEENFKELLYSIFDCDIAPEIGKIPDYILKRIPKTKKV